MSCWSRSLEGLDALGRLGLESLLLFVYPNLLSSRSIYRLKGGREVLRQCTTFESKRLLYPQFSTQSIVVFPQLHPLHFQILKRLIAQTLTTPILSVK